MSSGSSHKMYNWEVTPPPGVWDKIAAELDESSLAQQFPSTLYQAEVNPPAGAWQKIIAGLDDTALVNDYANKLSAIEVIPPATAWEKIKMALDPVEESAPQRRRIAPFIRYAAAAAILAFLAWGGIQLLDKKTSNDTAVVKEEIKNPVNPDNEAVAIKPVITPQDETIGTSGVEASIEEARNDAALEESKRTYAKLDLSTTRSKIKKASNFFFVPDDYDPYAGTRGLGFPTESTPQPAVVTTTAASVSSVDASCYITLMKPDGNIFRMSTKLKELVCCVSGEDEDKDCVDQMKRWRDKMANPSKLHSPGNFMDIVNMIHSLQDN